MQRTDGTCALSLIDQIRCLIAPSPDQMNTDSRPQLEAGPAVNPLSMTISWVRR